MNDWYSGIYKAFIISAIISFIIGFFSEGNVSLGAYISGYCVLILGIMMILLILFNRIMKITEEQSTTQILYTIFLTTGPFILMLTITIIMIVLLGTYGKFIVDHHVGDGYYSRATYIVAVLGFIGGFLVMMILDVALG